LAKLYPDIEAIKKLHQKPTEGEISLLTFLNTNLDNEFEVFFQPFVNGDRPDIVILKKKGGVVIIEVKDWDLNKYYIDSKTNWKLKKNHNVIKSPLSQVKSYKDNLFDLHIDKLLPKSMLNKYYHAVVSTVVYFHNGYENKVKSFLLDNFQGSKYEKYRAFVNYIECWGKDSLTPNRFSQFISAKRLNQKSKLFDQTLYADFKRYLVPPYHMKEEGKPIIYTKEQEKLITSEARPRRKIKGFAGSGKTFVMAKRAVNAYLRTKSKVLLLTYNLSLKNYIHDRINDVRENFPWDNFYITNYHQFIKTEANNYGLEIKSLNPFNDIMFFEPVKNSINKYQAIFIDEVQDYRTDWLEIIHKYFLVPEGEFVVFGDEKQNIYKRSLDENKDPRTIGIPGTWNRSLNVSKRFTDDIGRLALKFQKEFMSKKYSVEDLQIISNPRFDFENKTMKYFCFSKVTDTNELFIKYNSIVKKHNIHPSDITILSAKVSLLRDFDYFIRKELNEKTITTFETKEFWVKLKKEIHDRKKFTRKINNIRRNKKNHFWMKSGLTKLSSIHSYKGWESHTVFLIIEHEDSDNQFETAELIYTGLTRAQLNLFVFNLGNNSYHNFFYNKMDM
jgi:hypothetical protein